MFKLFPSSRHRDEKAPLLERPKDPQNSSRDWSSRNKKESCRTNAQSDSLSTPIVSKQSASFGSRASSERNITSKQSIPSTSRSASQDDYLNSDSLVTSIIGRRARHDPPVESSNPTYSSRSYHCERARGTKSTIQSQLTGVESTGVRSRSHVRNELSRCSSDRESGRLKKPSCSALVADCSSQKCLQKVSNKLAKNGHSLGLLNLLREVAAIVIQTCFRRCSTRSGQRSQQASNVILYQHQTHTKFALLQAAISIQRVWRGHNYRLGNIIEMQRLIRLWETKSIDFRNKYHAEAPQRMRKGPCKARSSHLYPGHFCIQKIQAFIRGWIARRTAEDMRSGRDIFFRLMEERRRSNSATVTNNDDNESFDIREADEVWLDSFDSIELSPSRISRERCISLIGLEPIIEEEEEVETLEQPCRNNNVQSPLEAAILEEQFEYSDPPIFSDDWSVDSWQCHSIQQDENDACEYRSLSGNDRKPVFHTHDLPVIPDPLSPPLISRSMSLKDETKEIFSVKASSFLGNILPTRARQSRLASCPTKIESVVSPTQKSQATPLSRSQTLQGIASKYRERSRSCTHMRNLSNSAVSAPIEISKGNLSKEEKTAVETKTRAFQRVLSDSALCDALCPKNQVASVGAAEPYLSPSAITAALTPESDSPTSIVAISRVLPADSDNHPSVKMSVSQPSLTARKVDGGKIGQKQKNKV